MPGIDRPLGSEHLVGVGQIGDGERTASDGSALPECYGVGVMRELLGRLGTDRRIVLLVVGLVALTAVAWFLLAELDGYRQLVDAVF